MRYFEKLLVQLCFAALVNGPQWLNAQMASVLQRSGQVPVIHAPDRPHARRSQSPARLSLEITPRVSRLSGSSIRDASAPKAKMPTFDGTRREICLFYTLPATFTCSSKPCSRPGVGCLCLLAQAMYLVQLQVIPEEAEVQDETERRISQHLGPGPAWKNAQRGRRLTCGCAKQEAAADDVIAERPVTVALIPASAKSSEEQVEGEITDSEGGCYKGPWERTLKWRLEKRSGKGTTWRFSHCCHWRS